MAAAAEMKTTWPSGAISGVGWADVVLDRAGSLGCGRRRSVPSDQLGARLPRNETGMSIGSVAHWP
ncbi:hypothetical protein GCM10010442_57370 [Kitasatospora kifunensis]